MKEFFIKLGDNPIYKKLMKEPITYVAGAALLAIFNIAHFAVLGHGWGVTGPFAVFGAWVMKLFGAHPENWVGFASDAEVISAGLPAFFSHGGSIRNMGVIFGALLATLFASQFKIKKIKSGKQVIAAVVGGLLMGYGARLASGCNIGALFTGTASLSLSGWIFAGMLLIGSFFGSKLLLKFFV